MDIATERDDAARKIFGKKLRRARQRKSMSGYALAKLAGCARSQITRYEQGLTSPTVSMVLKLAAALEIQPKDLVPNIAYHDD